MTTPIRRVLDLSHHNAVTDRQLVKDAGIWGIIHKATESTNYVDDKYLPRKDWFREVGILWGAYHFAHPGNVEAQVDYFLKHAGEDEMMLYALDWEASSTGIMSEDDAEKFMRLLEAKTGRKAVVYSGNVAKEKISGVNAYLGTCRLWLAQYGEPKVQKSWKGWWLWQYSDGQVGPAPHGCPGVTGYVDTNSFAGSRADLIDQWSGTGHGVSPPEVPVSPDSSKVVTVDISAPEGIRVDVTVNGRLDVG